jgi:hypothetical protein
MQGAIFVHKQWGSNLWPCEQLLIFGNELPCSVFSPGAFGDDQESGYMPKKGVRVVVTERSIEPKHEVPVSSIYLL